MKKRSFEAFPNIFLGRFAHSNSPNMTYRLKKDHNKLEFSRIYIGNPSVTEWTLSAGGIPFYSETDCRKVHSATVLGPFFGGGRALEVLQFREF